MGKLLLICLGERGDKDAAVTGQSFAVIYEALCFSPPATASVRWLGIVNELRRGLHVGRWAEGFVRHSNPNRPFRFLACHPRQQVG